MENIRSIFSKAYQVTVFLILSLFSVVAAISAAGIYKISIEASKDLLETRAVDIAVNVGFSLERLGLKEELFPSLVGRDRWDNLAYLALYDERGNILLHSNPLLIGRNSEDENAKRVILRRESEKRFSHMATGEKVFILDFPLRIHLESQEVPKGPGPKSHDASEPVLVEPVGGDWVYCLRVALHPYPAESIVRKANFQLALIGIGLIVLWTMTVVFFFILRKNYKLETKLREQQRMAALGEMAAVLAHEIRNPLSSIKGFAQFYQEQMSDPQAKEDFAIIINEAHRLERLTANLLTYARPARITPVPFKLDAICAEIKRTFAAGYPGVHFHTSCTQDLVHADKEKIMQILINLIQNAVDAVSVHEEARIWLTLRKKDKNIFIAVKDNGPGIAPEIKTRLFEPFVTTKTKGTGLGLAIVYRLVTALKGKIELKERPEGGTSVLIRLPAEMKEEQQ